jgi:hypothetical protein
MKRDNPIKRPCPRCKVKAGVKCRNYAGNVCAPHRERARPELLVDVQPKPKSRPVVKTYTCPTCKGFSPRSGTCAPCRRSMRRRVHAALPPEEEARSRSEVMGDVLLTDLVAGRARQEVRKRVSPEQFKTWDIQRYHTLGYWLGRLQSAGEHELARRLNAEAMALQDADDYPAPPLRMNFPFHRALAYDLADMERIGQ